MKIITNDYHMVHIYPVGLYRDIKNYLLDNFKPKFFLELFLGRWKNKSYYNGFLCEPYKLHPFQEKCGKGFTQGQAFRNYKKLLHEAKSTPRHPNCKCSIQYEPKVD